MASSGKVTADELAAALVKELAADSKNGKDHGEYQLRFKRKDGVIQRDSIRIVKDQSLDA